MKKWTNVVLANRNFELNTKEPENETPLTYRGLYDCYDRCSQTKQEIWLDWVEWFTNNGGYCTVASYNTNFFTISGYFTDPATDIRYYAYITPSHNRAWMIA